MLMWIVFVANAEIGVEAEEFADPSIAYSTISSSTFQADIKLPKFLKIPACLIASNEACLKIEPISSSKKYAVCVAVLIGSCLKVLSDSIFDCSLGCANNAIPTNLEFGNIFFPLSSHQ